MSNSSHIDPSKRNGEPGHPRLNREQYRVLGLSTLGGMLEYYEFIVFIFLAPVFSSVLFPPDMPIWLRVLQTLGIFASGYLVRPFGGLLLAALGDRLGRKRIFAVSLLLMAAPTLCIGLLPTYAQIGYWAPLALLICRLCQGLAMGGEFPTAITFIAEHVPTRRLGFAIGTLGGAFTLGSILATIVLMIVTAHYAPAEMLSTGWRIPFLLGGVFGFASSYLRRYVRETPVFEEMRLRKQISRVLPFRALLREQPVEVVLCLLASACTSGVLSGAMLFPVVYLQMDLGFARAVVTQAQLWMMAGLLAGALTSGVLSDRYGWTLVMSLFAAGTVVAIFVTFVVPDAVTLRYGWAAIGFGAGLTTILNGILVRSFTAEVRVTGIALTYNTSQALVGGLSPLLLGAISHVAPGAWAYVPIFFALLAAVVTPIAMRYRKPIHSIAAKPTMTETP